MPVTFYVEIPNFTKENAYNSAIAPFLMYYQLLEDNKKTIIEIKEELWKKKNMKKNADNEKKNPSSVQLK